MTNKHKQCYNVKMTPESSPIRSLKFQDELAQVAEQMSEWAPAPMEERIGDATMIGAVSNLWQLRNLQGRHRALAELSLQIKDLVRETGSDQADQLVEHTLLNLDTAKHDLTPIQRLEVAEYALGSLREESRFVPIVVNYLGKTAHEAFTTKAERQTYYEDLQQKVPASSFLAHDLIKARLESINPPAAVHWL